MKEAIEISSKNMTRVMMDWFSKDPVLFGAWCLLEKVPSKTISTIAVSTKAKNVHIKYNPNFISKLSTEKLELVMLSEVLRVLLRHPTTRLINPPVVSNMASKVTVSQCVNKTSCRSSNDEVTKLFKELELENDKCFEEYYRNILDQMNNPDKSDKIAKMFKQSDLKTDEDGYTEFNSENQAMSEYNSPFNGSSEEWGEHTDWDETVKGYVSDCKKSSKNWGKHTGSLQGTIEAASKSGINYRTLLANFAQTVRKEETFTSRMKYNRRYGLASPGYRHKETSKVLFALDASGSMSDGDLSEGFAIVNHTCRHSELSYLIFDTEIKHVEKNFKRPKKLHNVYGRGGTCVQAVIDYAEKANIDGLIIFTDGYLEKVTKPKHTKVLWLLTEDHPKDAFGFGKQVRLNRFYKR